MKAALDAMRHTEIESVNVEFEKMEWLLARFVDYSPPLKDWGLRLYNKDTGDDNFLASLLDLICMHSKMDDLILTRKMAENGLTIKPKSSRLHFQYGDILSLMAGQRGDSPDLYDLALKHMRLSLPDSIGHACSEEFKR